MAKTGKHHAAGASPRSGKVPPPEKRWKPGQSGNPNGRPVSRPLTAALKALAEQDISVKAGGKTLAGTRLQLLAEIAWRKAMSGDFRYFKELLDRLEEIDSHQADAEEDESESPGTNEIETGNRDE